MRAHKPKSCTEKHLAQLAPHCESFLGRRNVLLRLIAHRSKES
jgi:hypothetical protein